MRMRWKKFPWRGSLALLLAAHAPLAAWGGGEGPQPHLKVERASDGRFYLSGASCKLVFEEARAIRAWKIRIREASASDALHKIAPPTAESAKPCRMLIHGDLPKFVIDHHEGNAEANCWNTALVVNRLEKTIRAAKPDEITKWMKSSACRERKPGEKLEPGDIGVVRGKAPGNAISEQHAFTWISDSLVFEKIDIGSPYRLTTMRDMLGEFQKMDPTWLRVKNCQRAYGIPLDCSLYINYFTCQPPEASPGLPAYVEFPAG